MYMSVYICCMFIYLNVAGLKRNILMQSGIVEVCMFLNRLMTNGTVFHYDSKTFGQ